MKKKTRTPTARTLAALRKAGFLADVVERWIAQAGVRRDLFGIFDVLAIDTREPGLLAVQCTTKANVGARLRKMRQAPALRYWLRTGARAEVWGWFKDAAGRWQVHRVEVRADGLGEVPLVIFPRRRRARQLDLFDR